MSTQAQDAGTRPAPRSGALAIEAADLVKTYPKGVRALDGLSFAVRRGHVFGLLGPNGAGKSTTVKILTTLAQADSGPASVAGLDVRAAGRRGAPRHRRGRPAIRSRPGRHRPGEPAAVRAGSRACAAAARAAGPTSCWPGSTWPRPAGRQVRTYSGGMQRRLDVALGLIHRPEVLFLDEPTAGLDPESRSAMWEEIARLSAGEGLTILLTTHYLEEADRLASRLAIVDRGRIVAAGTPDELKGRLHGDTVQVELAAPGIPGAGARGAGPGARRPGGHRDGTAR